ncbi:MAG: carboxypeptidase M32 [Thermoplasmatota archaeon]
MRRVYGEFLAMVKELAYLEQIGSLLSWDEETYMPPGAVPDRALQKAALSGIAHERLTSKRLGALLRELRRSPRLSPDQRVVVREVERRRTRAVRIPRELVKELAKTESLAVEAWVRARRQREFGIFRPMLKRMMGLKARVAEHVGYEDRPYDALLDEYEPYMKSADVERLFTRLRGGLVPLASRILSESAAGDSPLMRGEFPEDKQRELVLGVVRRLGYDMARGRVDVAPHPFTSGGNRDVRITVRYSPDDIRPALFAAIHEAGHAMYEQGFLERHYHTPLAESVSLGIHESQSRLWENFIGRSLPFCRHCLPRLRELFPRLEPLSPEDLHRAVNLVRRSFIRVEADEVTYNLHIMLRFEVESAIFEGELRVEEVPQFWNERFESYLDLKVPDDSQGCLQDIHWSIGAVGYFPTYSLGNIYAAQLYHRMRRDIPDLDERVASGDFALPLGWLREKVHRHGKRYRAGELIRRVTGEGLNEERLLQYLREKYGALYGVSL